MFKFLELSSLKLLPHQCFRLTEENGEVTLITEVNLQGGVCGCCTLWSDESKFIKWELIDLKDSMSVIASGTEKPHIPTETDHEN